MGLHFRPIHLHIMAIYFICITEVVEFPARIIEEEENLPDGALLCTIIIPNMNCATKKTANQIVYVRGKPMVIPSKRYAQYEKYCKPFCEEAWKNTGKKPINFGVAIYFKVWRSTWVLPDHTGVLQAVADILQKWGVVEDDQWIMWNSGESKDGVPTQHWHQGIDKENPRLEMEIRRYRHPYEQFRSDQQSEEKRLFEKRGGPRKSAKK